MTAPWQQLDRKGAMAVEFALTVSILLALTFGMIQVGVLFIATAGLKHGIGEAARVSTLWPARTNEQITAELRAKVFGIDKSKLGTPIITRGQSQGIEYTEITASYVVPMDLFMIPLPSVTLTETRRSYVP
jgi:hypothetical protein